MPAGRFESLSSSRCAYFGGVREKHRVRRAASWERRRRCAYRWTGGMIGSRRHQVIVEVDEQTQGIEAVGVA